MEYDRVKINNDLKRFGLSITAIEIKGIMKAIDYLIENEAFDKEKIGMTGLSYGGYYTLYTMAAEKRIKRYKKQSRWMFVTSVGFFMLFYNKDCS